MCKHLFISVVCLGWLIPATLQAQVGIGTNDPDPSAILELQSNNQGLLLPRMTIAQRNAINSPATGLMVFNLENLCLEANIGTPEAPDWECMVAPQTPNPVILVNEDTISSKTLTSPSGAVTLDIIQSFPFTLTRDATVHISYYCAVQQMAKSNGSPILDGRAYYMGTFLAINDVIKIYGASSSPYSNSGGFFDFSAIAGVWYLGGSCYLELPAGTHTIHLYGSVFGLSDVRGIFGGNGFEQMQIVAYYK